MSTTSRGERGEGGREGGGEGESMIMFILYDKLVKEKYT
jgi:hypothetical protein